jgi:hypothetical protein
VWPPTSAAPTSARARESEAKRSRTRPSAVPGGTSTTARNQRGRAPQTATSFALTTTDSHAMSSAVSVIGSAATTSVPAGTSIPHASSPILAPGTSGGGGSSASRLESNWCGSLPLGGGRSRSGAEVTAAGAESVSWARTYSPGRARSSALARLPRATARRPPSPARRSRSTPGATGAPGRIRRDQPTVDGTLRKACGTTGTATASGYPEAAFHSTSRNACGGSCAARAPRSS